MAHPPRLSTALENAVAGHKASLKRCGLDVDTIEDAFKARPDIINSIWKAAGALGHLHCILDNRLTA